MSRELLIESIRTIRDLSEKLKRYEVGFSDIAVVGIGLRFPGGADSMGSYWELLRTGGSGIGEVKSDRWPADAFLDARPSADGKLVTPFAGMLDAIYDFDPEFFGLSAVEAENLDPQQRLLLEVSWAALEDSNLQLDRMRGSNTGVFIGIGSADYGIALMSEAASINPYIASGNSLSMAAGRLAYFYDFCGPAMSIDTACSSSLVAVDEACRRLRRGECQVALAGGVSAILTPHASINFSKAGMLTAAADCHTFDARACGYVRGEGCGLLVLKPLEHAVRDGDRIHGVIKGSAVNHDGRSGGLTVPNGPAQEAVIRAALLDARLQAADISYVEAHGTGTSLGDPIEANALARVFAEGRPADQGLLIGAVKANLGHLEAAAGVAGLIKALLVAAKGEAPPQRGFDILNPKIDWNGKAIGVAGSAGLPRPVAGGVIYAGVSSFGFSGTNAHVIVAGPPIAGLPIAGLPIAASAAGEHVVVVSAKSRQSLIRLTLSLADYLDCATDAALRVISYTLACRRASFHERIAVVGRSACELAQKLRTVARQAPTEGRRCRIVLHVTAQDGAALTQGLASLLPPHAAHNGPAAVIAALARIGLVPDVVIGEGFSVEGLDAMLSGVSGAGAGAGAGAGWATAIAGAPARRLASPQAAGDLVSDAVLLSWGDTCALPTTGATSYRLDDEAGVIRAIAAAFSAGSDIDFAPIFPAGLVPAHDLPSYPFERRTLRSLLLDDFVERAAAPAPKALNSLASVGAVRPDGSASYLVDLDAFAFLDEHQVGGRRIAPASLIIALMCSFAQDARGATDLDRDNANCGAGLSSIKFEHPVDADAFGCVYQMLVDPPGAGAGVSLWSCREGLDGRSAWRRHASAILQDPPASSDISQSWEMAETLDVAALYAAHQEKGVRLGPAFRGVQRLQRTGKHVCGEVRLAAGAGESFIEATSLLLDGCFQVTAALHGSAEGVFLLSTVAGLELRAQLPRDVQVVGVRLDSEGADDLRFHLSVENAQGEQLCRIEEAVFRRCATETPIEPQKTDLGFFIQHWTPVEPTECEGQGGRIQMPMRDVVIDCLEMAADLAARARQTDLSAYQVYRLEAEQVCRRLVAEAMAQVGWSALDGSEAAPARFGVVPSQTQLFHHFARRLGSGRAGTGGDLDSLSRFPRFAAETDFLVRCAKALPAVLRGERDPLDILFGDESLNGSEAVYVDSPISVALNGHLAAIAARVARAAERKIRIVEIGAGTGSTSRAVFDALPWDQVESYHYTDVSPLFLDRARSLFTGLDKVKYRIFNIEEPVELQHFAVGAFDIVIAANVLHATRSLEQTMRHVAQLLAPGGYVLLRECVEPQLSADISFGMTPGWWRFEDQALRPDYPLLSAAAWEAFLPRCGFSAPTALQPGTDATEAVIVAQKAARTAQSWLIVHSGQDEAVELVRAVEALGDAAVLLVSPPTLDGDDAALAAAAGDASFDHILCLPLLSAISSEVAATAELLYERTLSFCRACFTSSAARSGRLWMLTTGAEMAAEGDLMPGLAQSVMTGIVKAAALEHPTQVGGAVDLDGSQASLSRVVAHIRSPGAERYLASRRGVLLAARLRFAEPSSAGVGDQGPTLITGALGGIGFAFAEAAAKHPGARLILVGRDMQGAGKAAQLSALRRHGAELHCFSVDTADAQAVRGMFEALAAQGMTPAHIVHAAGVGGDMAIARSAPGSLRAVTAAKIAGSWNLHRYSDAEATKSFIIVSTMLSLWGARDRVHYVLGNHFADRVAQHRTARGLPGLALQLGPVECGMLGTGGKAAADRVGVRTFTAAEAADLLLRPPLATGGQMAVIKADWGRLARAYGQTWIGSYFIDVAAAAPDAQESADGPSDRSLALAYGAVEPAERNDVVEAGVFAMLRDALGLRGTSRAYRHTGFHDLGMDSLLTLSFAERLSRATGLKVTSSTLFDHSNLARLSVWIGDSLGDRRDAAPEAKPIAPTLTSVSAKAADSWPTGDDFERELRAMEQLLEGL